MNLDDMAAISRLDQNNLLGHIDRLPDQLWQAWELGQKLDLPAWPDLRQVIVCGMGGSGAAAEILAAFGRSESRVPIFVHRDYGLPAFAQSAGTLVIAVSRSGNSEEIISAFESAQRAKTKLIALTGGGRLADIANRTGTPVWPLEHQGQREGLGTSFGLLLAAMARLGLLPDAGNELRAAIQAMRDQQAELKAESPVVHNIAKRIAGQMMGRWVVILGAGLMAPVAQRWKNQINKLGKAWAQAETLPEADHNTVMGILHPEAQLQRMLAMFLRSPGEHPKNQQRLELTRQMFMLEGINTDFIDARGNSPLAHLCTTLHFGEYVAYYLAIAYGVEPEAGDAIEGFKEALADR